MIGTNWFRKTHKQQVSATKTSALNKAFAGAILAKDLPKSMHCKPLKPTSRSPTIRLDTTTSLWKLGELTWSSVYTNLSPKQQSLVFSLLADILSTSSVMQTSALWEAQLLTCPLSKSGVFSTSKDNSPLLHPDHVRNGQNLTLWEEDMCSTGSSPNGLRRLGLEENSNGAAFIRSCLPRSNNPIPCFSPFLPSFFPPQTAAMQTSVLRSSISF